MTVSFPPGSDHTVTYSDLAREEAYDPAAACATQRVGRRSHRGRGRTSEAQVCAEVDRALAATPRCYILNVTGSAEQTAGTPDRVGVVDGRAFVCEIKAPGETPRRLQLMQLRRWQAAGAISGWVTSVSELEQLLARVHDGQWTNPLTGPGDPTLGGTHDGQADGSATAGGS